MAKISTRAAISIIGLFGVILGSASVASAQESPPMCGGFEATIFESIEANEENELVIVNGTEGDDVIVVDTAARTDVFGLGGDDIICVDGVFNVWGGSGDDTIYVMGPPVELRVLLFGGPGNDELHGGNSLPCCGAGSYVETLVGDGGDDTIYGNDGHDYIYGMDGDDTIYGNAGRDTIFGGGGTDTIYGGWGDDALFGGDPSPELEEADASTTPDLADTIYGGPGNDYLAGRLGADQLYGGDGNDTLIANLAQSLDSVDATTSLGGIDTAGSRMFGGTGDDLVVGSNRWDRIQGGPGNDTLWGFEGRDYIRGGPGNDQIVGGGGIDDINGNTGSDHLIYSGADKLRGGWGLDRCEATVWPAGSNTTSCERIGSPTLTYAVSDDYERLADFQVRQGVSISERALRIGDCLLGDFPNFTGVAVNKVDCELEHRYEIYREALIDSSIPEFDALAISTYAEEVCRLSLVAYLPANDDRNLEATYRTPSWWTWDDPVDPDRTITCLLFDADGEPLVGRAA